MELGLSGSYFRVWVPELLSERIRRDGHQHFLTLDRVAGTHKLHTIMVVRTGSSARSSSGFWPSPWEEWKAPWQKAQRYCKHWQTSTPNMDFAVSCPITFPFLSAPSPNINQRQAFYSPRKRFKLHQLISPALCGRHDQPQRYHVAWLHDEGHSMLSMLLLSMLLLALKL